MTLAHLQLVTMLALAPEGDAAAKGEPAAAEASTKIATIILVAGPLPYRELEDALRIRLPRLRTLPYERRSFEDVEGESYAYVELTEPSAPPGAIDIAVILSDGRSYGRRLVPDENEPVRDTATMLANTIAAIEEERLQPVRDDVAIPVIEEPIGPIEDTPPDDPPEKRVPEKPRWSIGFGPSFGAVAGLAPSPTLFAGGSVAFDLVARAPIGLTVATGVRFTTRDSGLDVRVSRIRLLLGLGYAYRYRSFELLAIGAFTVEPWLLGSSGGDRPFVGPGDPVAPMLGGLGRISPGAFISPKRTPNFALRVGLYAELAGSAVPGDGAPRLVIQGTRELIARLGGLELATGADMTFWFTVPRRR